MVRAARPPAASDISRTGHSTVYGIYFGTGKADVKPELDAALAEIAKLLQQNAKLRLYGDADCGSLPG
jgi:OOP family OmpA-OmpF porin